MAKQNLETSSTFTCMICLDPPIDPENCPDCSQFVCKLCIDNWFKKSTRTGYSSCPQCRKVTQRSNFKKLACLQDLLKLINDREKELEHSKMNECSQHAKQQLCVYCSTCSKAICAQCISSLFNGEHINHVYSQLDSAQQRLLKAFEEKEKNIQDNLSQLNKSIQNKKFIINQIWTRKKKIFDEIEEFQTMIKNEIEFDVTKLVKKFQNEGNALIKEMNDYKTSCCKLKDIIQSTSQIKLFEQEKELTLQILQQTNVLMIDTHDSPNYSIESPLAFSWQTCTVTTEQFSVKQQNNNSLSSPLVQIDHDQYWTFITYPNGMGCHKGIYLSSMIQLTKGTSQLVEYEFIIELIHHLHDDNQHNYALKDTKSFKEGQIYGFEQFYQLNELSNNGFINPKTDSVKIRYKLRPKSILEQRKLFRWQIEHYKKEQQNKDEKIKEMSKIKDEIIQLQQDNNDANQIIDDLKNKIKDLESNNTNCKRKKRATRN